MKLYCSTRGNVGAKKPKKPLSKLKKAGFSAIFIDFEYYMDDEIPIEDAITSIKNQCLEMGITCDIIQRQSARVLAAIEQDVSIDKIKGEFIPNDNLTMNDMVLIKNEYIDFNGRPIRRVHNDAVDIAARIDKQNELAGFEKYGCCLDVGVCTVLGQNMYDYILTLGNRIKAVILRDTDGDCNNALLPFTSSNRGSSRTDWLNLIRGLREIEFDGALIMDFCDTGAVISGLLREQFLSMAYSIGTFLSWQIGMLSMLKKHSMRVLFGAGNMCRNYMKCYGDEFPPLFTCDNDKRRWGEQFEGLEIKPPETLKELPSECAIIICNIYYKEIRQQLRDMNIQNPIEYFNDEYMPSYYLDKLEYWEGDN